MRLNRIRPYLYFLPALILALLFTYIPFIKTISYLNIKTQFSAYKGFLSILLSKDFLNALYTTLIYALFIVPTTLLSAIISALGVSSLQKSRSFFEYLFILPMAIAMSAIAIAIQIMFEPNLGIINSLFSLDIQWFENALAGRFLIIFISYWMAIGLDFAIIYSYIRGIPKTYIEVAKLEGASPAKLFFYVQMPIIWPSLAYVTIVNLKSSLLLSGPIILLTEGVNETQSLLSLMYQKGFVFGDYAYSSALSLITFAISLLIITISYFFIWKKRQTYV